MQNIFLYLDVGRWKNWFPHFSVLMEKKHFQGVFYWNYSSFRKDHKRPLVPAWTCTKIVFHSVSVNKQKGGSHILSMKVNKNFDFLLWTNLINKVLDRSFTKKKSTGYACCVYIFVFFHLLLHSNIVWR